MAALAVGLSLSAVARGGDIKTYRLSANVGAPEPAAASGAVQRAHHGGEGNGPSGISIPSVSGDGALVAFDSVASNLEQPSALAGAPVLADTNGVADIFVHDTRTRLNRRITTTVTGGEANGPSRNPAMSEDGLYVAFESDASNLVNFDLNGKTDVFLHNNLTGDTTLASRSLGGASGNGASRRPSLGGNGPLVAFESDATDLVPGDLNGKTDVFVVSNPGTPSQRAQSITRGGNGSSGDASLVASGFAVAFASGASNLVSGDTNNASDVFLQLIPSGYTQRVSVGPTWGQGDGDSRAPSWVGSFSIAFESDAMNLTEQPDLNGATDVFVRDSVNWAGATTILVSRGANGTAKGTSRAPTASRAGLVAFVSDAGDLVRGLPPTSVPQQGVYLADLTTGKVEAVSADAGVVPNGPSFAPGISDDGLFIAYGSDASNLVMDDTNGVRDVFGRIDERRCANGAVESGPASSRIHDAERNLGPAESLVHTASCEIASFGP